VVQSDVVQSATKSPAIKLSNIGQLNMEMPGSESD
jgi:hypothetical protein